MLNAAGLNRTADANPVRSSRTVQSANFRDRVVVRLAFAVSKPGEKSHGYDDHGAANCKFCLFLHDEHLHVIRAILSQALTASTAAYLRSVRSPDRTAPFHPGSVRFQPARS